MFASNHWVDFHQPDSSRNLQVLRGVHILAEGCDSCQRYGQAVECGTRQRPPYYRWLGFHQCADQHLFAEAGFFRCQPFQQGCDWLLTVLQHLVQPFQQAWVACCQFYCLCAQRIVLIAVARAFHPL